MRSWNGSMPDFLDVLALDARKTVEEGYYRVPSKAPARPASLRDAILKCERAPIISEIKFASPSAGLIREKGDATQIARAMEGGGAVGISVLTEPKHFGGSLDTLARVRSRVWVPLLMKDVILSPVQVEAASRMGANAVLLIQALFERSYCESGIHDMIECAHSKGLEVLSEAHTEEEFLSTLATEADIIGINNRDLKTLEVDLGATRRILAKNRVRDRVIVSESGISSPADIRFLHRCGAHAFLVGSSIMRAGDIEKRVKELVAAL